MKQVCCVWLALLMCGCAEAPPATAPLTHVAKGDEAAVQAYLRDLITHEMRANRVPGLSIAVVDDQRVVWAQGFGMADPARGVAATSQTIYRVGGMSELLSTVAAMQLAEQGRLGLDAPLRSQLPQFNMRGRASEVAAITPRLLMSHHAGLPAQWLKGRMSARAQPFCELLEALHDADLEQAPGQALVYSEVGVSVLGCLVQQLSGEPFAQHLQRAVLQPLGMTDASFDPGVSAHPLMAQGHRLDQAEVEPEMRDLPALGLNASVQDLAQFMTMVFAGGTHGGQRLLSAEGVAEMLRVQNADVALDLNVHVGLGWMLSSLGRSAIQGGGIVAHHAGATRLFCSQLYILPQHKLGVVVLANSSAARQLVDHVASQALALELALKTGTTQAAWPGAPAFVPSDDPALAQAMVGEYTTILGPVRVFADGGHLRAGLGDHLFELRRRTDGQFGLDYTLLGVLHLRLGGLSDVGLSRRCLAGHEVLVARLGEQEMVVGEKVLPPAAMGAWARRLGGYEIVNLGDDLAPFGGLRVQQEGEYLVVEWQERDAADQPARALLMPINDDEAVLLGSLANSGAHVHVRAGDGQTLLESSGYLLRRLSAKP